MSSLALHPATRTHFAEIVEALVEWHAKNERTFVWRGKRTPYVVLVSEFMLQQTGTKQVQKMLPIFLRRFPNVRALAAAKQSDVLRAWQGLGYNRRALNLHRAAIAIAARGRRPFPQTLEELRALPGVGAYTAAAVMTFAFDADTPVVDVNIERVLSRLWKQMPTTHDVLPMKKIAQLDELIFPRGRSAVWHEALMDLGSTICTKRSPECANCPLLNLCKSGQRFEAPQARQRTAARQKETRHFGEPRRIWRGRILGAVAERSPITVSALTTQLAREYTVAESGFAAFVLDVAERLEKEGFVRRQKNSLILK